MKAICRFLAMALLSIFAMSVHAKYSVDFYPDIWIKTYDNLKLSANIYVPRATYPGEKFPAIIFISSWGMDKAEYLKQAEKFADKGYVVLSYTGRGWFNSEGVINTAGPDDMHDISSSVDFMLANYPVDVNNIGMAGISYGGGLALLGIAHEPRVKTVVSMSGWANLWEVLFGAETPRALWSRMLINTSNKSGHPGPELEKNFQSLLNYENLDEVNQWTMQRSVYSYVDQINARTSPTSIFICNNLEDELFPPNSMLAFYNKLNVRKKIDLNLGSHATAEIGGVLGVPNNPVWTKVHAWFDHELRGVSTGSDKWSPVTLSVKLTDDREDYANIPPANVKDNTFYLIPRGDDRKGVLANANAKTKDVDSIRSPGISGMFTAVPIITGGMEGQFKVPVTAYLPLTNHYVSIYYQTDPLEKGMKIRGTARVQVPIQANNDKAQLIAYLYDVDRTGMGTLISYGPVTLHNLQANTPVNATVELVTTAYNIPANHSLALGFDTYELQFSPPTIWPYQISFMQNAKNPGVLTVPVLS
jgi:predicted acyl esterase